MCNRFRFSIAANCIFVLRAFDLFKFSSNFISEQDRLLVFFQMLLNFLSETYPSRENSNGFWKILVIWTMTQSKDDMTLGSCSFDQCGPSLIYSFLDESISVLKSGIHHIFPLFSWIKLRTMLLWRHFRDNWYPSVENRLTDIQLECLNRYPIEFFWIVFNWSILNEVSYTIPRALFLFLFVDKTTSKSLPVFYEFFWVLWFYFWDQSIRRANLRINRPS